MNFLIALVYLVGLSVLVAGLFLLFIKGWIKLIEGKNEE